MFTAMVASASAPPVPAAGVGATPASRTRTPTLRLERRCWGAGEQVVVGIDEVGRGAWAGPVTVAGSVDDLCWRITGSATASQPGTAERLLTAGRAEPDTHPYRRSAAMSMLLARAIATSHRGGLGITHEPSGCTAVTLWLPIL